MLDLSYAQLYCREQREIVIWKSLKAGLHKMKQRELLLHFMYGKIGFAILPVLCAFTGDEFWAARKGYDSVQQNRAGAWKTWLRISLGFHWI